MTEVLVLGGASWNRMIHVGALPQGEWVRYRLTGDALLRLAASA